MANDSPGRFLPTRGVHGDGILVPSPPHPRKKFDPSSQAPAYFLSTKGGNNSHHSRKLAILKIPHSASLTVNFKL